MQHACRSISPAYAADDGKYGSCRFGADKLDHDMAGLIGWVILALPQVRYWQLSITALFVVKATKLRISVCCYSGLGVIVLGGASNG